MKFLSRFSFSFFFFFCGGSRGLAIYRCFFFFVALFLVDCSYSYSYIVRWGFIVIPIGKNLVLSFFFVIM